MKSSRGAATAANSKMSAQLLEEERAHRRDKIAVAGAGEQEEEDDDGANSDEERKDEDWKRRNKHRFTVEQEESPRHPRFGEVIWVNYTTNRWWPGFAFRPSQHLRKEVLELFAGRTVGEQFLVCYCGRGDFSLSTTPQIESFNPNDAEKIAKVKGLRGFEAAYAIAVEQFNISVDKRRLGYWSPLTGLPDVWIMRRPKPSFNNNNKSSSPAKRRDQTSAPSDDAENGMGEEGEEKSKKRHRRTMLLRRTCFNCGVDFTVNESSSLEEEEGEAEVCASCVKRAPCDVCGSEADEDNFLLCSQRGCFVACHVYCTPFSMSEREVAEIQTIDWFCPSHECMRRCETGEEGNKRETIFGMKVVPNSSSSVSEGRFASVSIGTIYN